MSNRVYGVMFKLLLSIGRQAIHANDHQTVADLMWRGDVEAMERDGDIFGDIS